MKTKYVVGLEVTSEYSGLYYNLSDLVAEGCEVNLIADLPIGVKGGQKIVAAGSMGTAVGRIIYVDIEPSGPCDWISLVIDWGEGVEYPSELYESFGLQLLLTDNPNPQHRQIIGFLVPNYVEAVQNYINTRHQGKLGFTPVNIRLVDDDQESAS